MRRMQAQTLAAHWQQEIERIEDAPRLQAARQLAKPGAVEDLRSAIARAGQIESDQPSTQRPKGQSPSGRIKFRPLKISLFSIELDATPVRDASARRFKRSQPFGADGRCLEKPLP